MTTQTELDEFRADVQAWLADNKPVDPGFLLPETFMEVGTDQQFEFLRDWQRTVYEAGYLGMACPSSTGWRSSPGLSGYCESGNAKARAPFVPNTIGLNWAGPLILDMGSEEDKQRYIKNILSAEDILRQGFSEPDNGSDLGNAQVRAVRDGDDYVVNGSKIWTSLGSYAKYRILLARTSTDGPNKYAGLTFFLAPMKVEGVDPVPIRN